MMLFSRPIQVVVLLYVAALSFAETTSRRLGKVKRWQKAGLGIACSRNNTKAYNVCLDLVTIKIQEGVTSGVCGSRSSYPLFSSLLTDGLLYCVPSFPLFENPVVDRVTFDAGWMKAAYNAKRRLEAIIKGDYVAPFSPLAVAGAGSRFTNPFGYESSLSWPNSTNVLVDDVYINIAADQPAPFTGIPLSPSLASGLLAGAITSRTSGNARAGTVNATSRFLGLTCRIDLYFGGPGPVGGPEYLGYRRYKGTPTMQKVLLHEMLHCIGLQTTNAKSFLQTHTDGVSPIWVGTNALTQWKKIGCNGSLPMDIDSGLHFNSTCIPSELMNPAIPVVPFFSTLTGGILQDLGYTSIDYKKLRQFKTKELGGGKCGDFCPAANLTKRRILEGDESATSSSDRVLEGSLTTDTTDFLAIDGAASPEEYDVFMKALYDQYVSDGMSPDESIHLLFATEDGRFFEMHGSYAEAIAYAEEQGYAVP